MNTAAFKSNSCVWNSLYALGICVVFTSLCLLYRYLALSFDSYLNEIAEHFDLKTSTEILESRYPETILRPPRGGASGNSSGSCFTERWVCVTSAVSLCPCHLPWDRTSSQASGSLALCVSLYVSVSLCLCFPPPLLPQPPLSP